MLPNLSIKFVDPDELALARSRQRLSRFASHANHDPWHSQTFTYILVFFLIMLLYLWVCRDVWRSLASVHHVCLGIEFKVVRFAWQDFDLSSHLEVHAHFCICNRALQVTSFRISALEYIVIILFPDFPYQMALVAHSFNK